MTGFKNFEFVAGLVLIVLIGGAVALSPLLFPELCALIARLDPGRRPPCVFVCMPFGAHLAAKTLIDAGAPPLVA